MKTNNNWTLGELVILPQEVKDIKKKGDNSFTEFITSRYICIREATNTQRGILVKALGKLPAENISIINGAPFCKDELDEMFYAKRYYSFPFPAAEELKEALNIIRGNQTILNQFADNKMHINTDATFWVKETSVNKWLRKKLQYLDAQEDSISQAHSRDVHYRLSIVQFSNDELFW